MVPENCEKKPELFTERFANVKLTKIIFLHIIQRITIDNQECF